MGCAYFKIFPSIRFADANKSQPVAILFTTEAAFLFLSFHLTADNVHSVLWGKKPTYYQQAVMADRLAQTGKMEVQFIC